MIGCDKAQSVIVESGNSFISGYTENVKLTYLIVPDTCKEFSYEYIQQTPNLKKMYLPDSIVALSEDGGGGSYDPDISYYQTTWCAGSTSTAAKFAQEKGYPYQNLDDHTHELESVTFYEDEFVTVIGKYCKECGYGTDTSYEWKKVAKYPKEQSPVSIPTKTPDADEIVRLDDEGKDNYGIPYIVEDLTHTATAGAEGWDDYVYQGEEDGVVEIPAYVQKGNEVYSVTKIGDFLFENNKKLQRLKIPDTCVQIGENALAGSGIKHLYIGKNVKTITNDTLGRLENLEDLVVDEKNGYYLMWNGAMYTTDLTHLIVGPAGKEGACFVPSTVERIGKNPRVETAKNFADKKGISYKDLSEHTHDLHELVFFEDDTAKVSCQYCEECAYSEGFSAENKRLGTEVAIPVRTPAIPSPTPSGKPTPSASAAASWTPSTPPASTPTVVPTPVRIPTASPAPMPTVFPTSAAASEVLSTPAVTVTPAISPDMPETPSAKKRKSSTNKMKAPNVIIRKRGSGKNVYLIFYLKKYKGKYVEIYMKKKKKFVRISLSENRIKKYKGKMKLKCLIKNKKLFFKVRTFDKKKKKRKYSAYSKVLTVKV